MDKKVRDFITQNHEYLTILDMSEELGIDYGKMAPTCRNLNIKPITIRERNKNYIFEMKGKISFERIRSALGLNEQSFINFYNELGLVKDDFEVIEISVPWKSPSQVFQEFALRGSHHFKEDKNSHLFDKAYERMDAGNYNPDNPIL